MKPSDRRLSVMLALIMAAYLVPHLARAAEGSFNRTLRVTGPVQLDVSTGSGAITVRPGNSSSLEVHGVIKANNSWGLDSGNAEEKVRRLESNPPIEQDGNFIRIGHIEDRDLRNNVSISYELTVPPQTEIKCGTGSGNIEVEGVHGPAHASTGSGNISISNLGDEVSASTGSGRIILGRVKGPVRATDGSGTIQASDIAGNFHLSTGSGDIQLSEISPGDGNVSTGSGNVKVTGVHGALRVGAGSGSISAQGHPTGGWVLHTGSGSLTVRIDPGASFDLDAHTDSGQIETQRSVTVQGTLRRGTLRGKVGSGGPLVNLRTGSGSIRID
ncbi:MAG TPA: DUF4097 family beta strand repeat-containing protein [Terriglobia bacterium]|nr:DUF4097 family beta strand repeat-containing protein [Terriglobia bacterium]